MKHILRGTLTSLGLMLAPAGAVFATATAAAGADQYGVEAVMNLGCERGLARLETGMAAGNGHALSTAAQLHDEGTCVGRDPARAAALWQQALAAGHPDAPAALALKMGLGDGIAQDYAAAGELLQRGGVKLVADTAPDSYSLGYAYTWLQTVRQGLRYTRTMESAGVDGTADVGFDPRSGETRLLGFRRNRLVDTPVGTRIDRSRSVVGQAVSEAAEAARARVPRPDLARVGHQRFREAVMIAPTVDPNAAQRTREVFEKFVKPGYAERE